MAAVIDAIIEAALAGENAAAIENSLHNGQMAGPVQEVPDAVKPMVGSRAWPHCTRCGMECIRLTSHTALNPGRVFFKCPQSGENENP
jgi:hypothetical protein